MHLTDRYTWRSVQSVIKIKHAKRAVWTIFTGQILSECSGDVMQIKVAIIKVDKEQCLVKCSEKAHVIVDVAKNVGWSRLVMGSDI